jgi:hypothetical protein
VIVSHALIVGHGPNFVLFTVDKTYEFQSTISSMSRKCSASELFTEFSIIQQHNESVANCQRKTFKEVSSCAFVQALRLFRVSVYGLQAFPATAVAILLGPRPEAISQK